MLKKQNVLFGRAYKSYYEEEEYETVSYVSYETKEKTPSKYIKNLTFKKPTGLSCPSCGYTLESMGHGDTQDCKGCNLSMQLFGNALHIWK